MMRTIQLSIKTESHSRVLLSQVQVAESFMNRLVGLMGRKEMASDSALWIYHCNSIHTCFMNFAIDCVFVDKNLKIKKIVKAIRPWRLILPIWGATSVFEMSAGKAEELNLREGDALYVGH